MCPRLRFCFFSFVLLWLTHLDKILTFKEQEKRKRGRENSLTCLLAWSMELSMGNTNRLFLAVILLTKDLNELCGEVGTHIHSMTRSFGRFLLSMYLVRLFIDIIWKWILQCVWRILFTKKENLIFNQLPFPALTLSILFDTEHISPKFLVLEGGHSHHPGCTGACCLNCFDFYPPRIGMVLHQCGCKF